MRFHAVLFDLDGTLVDSLHDIGQAMNHSLVVHGRRPHPLADYAGFVGEGVKVLARKAAPDASEEELASLLEGFRAYYVDHLVNSTLPYPGIPEVLEACAARGQKLAVLSNKSHGFTQAIVQRLLPQVPFAHVWGEQPERYPRKPDPKGALELARLLDVAPGACAFVGDTAVDMLTARDAGMHAVAVTWGFRPRGELEPYQPYALVDDAQALGRVLRG
jgi:phosphoglycolate phosphatase